MSPTRIPPLSDSIRGLLSRLRWRIRLYVWLEGLALAMLWLALTFWLALAIDYLPILVGASELPRAARGVLLAVIGGVLALIVYRWILRRTFVRLRDRSLAVLLERRFGVFHDSLVTAVELHQQPQHAADFSEQMLSHTHQEALQHIGAVKLGGVFRLWPLAWKLVAAGALLIPIGIFSVAGNDAFSTWINRLYLLRNDPWPRSSRIEVVGIEVVPSVLGSSSGPPRLVEFQSQSVKVAAGSSVAVKVRADAGARVVPEYCTLYYQTADGDRGRVNLEKAGRPQDGYQLYSFDGKPFQGIVSGLRFDVVGFDHRVRDYAIQVVDIPAIVSTRVDCEFPSYVERLPLADQELIKGMQLARGSHVTLRSHANKPLVRVVVKNGATQAVQTIDVDPNDSRSFRYPVGTLDSDLSLEITLHDTDGIVTDRPERIFIAAVPDEAPRVRGMLRGIGTAVTPDVILPWTGSVEDDYGVGRSWIEVQVNGGQATRDFDFKLGRDGVIDAETDLRDQRTIEGGLQIKQQDKLLVAVRAADKYDLESGPNQAIGDRYELDVVDPAELLRILEREELGLRRRFELIVGEMGEARDTLVRVHDDLLAKSSGNAAEDPGAAADEPGDEKLDPAAKAERARSLRLLRTQRAQIQSRKSSQETLGVAESFISIRDQLVNNRVVDTEDRKSRLENQIAIPLRKIVDDRFPELDETLRGLEENLERPELAPQLADAAVQQASDLLAEMEAVLQKMLELETYNELVDLVRNLLKQQTELTEATKKEQKGQLLKDLIKKE